MLLQLVQNDNIQIQYSDASKFIFELSIDMHTTLSYIAPKFNKRHIDCNKHCNISVKTLYIILVTY